MTSKRCFLFTIPSQYAEQNTSSSLVQLKPSPFPVLLKPGLPLREITLTLTLTLTLPTSFLLCAHLNLRIKPHKRFQGSNAWTTSLLSGSLVGESEGHRGLCPAPLRTSPRHAEWERAGLISSDPHGSPDSLLSKTPPRPGSVSSLSTGALVTFGTATSQLPADGWTHKGHYQRGPIQSAVHAPLAPDK